jgi:molybdopterin synthase sulfur carrier subunit
MQIKVKLFATFRTGRFSEVHRDYAPGTRIADVIRELQIIESEVGMIMLNGKHAEPHEQLQDGASLSLFPLLGGG